METNPFLGCPNYQAGKDDKYAQCLLNMTGNPDPCTLIRDLHRAKEFRAYFLAIIPFILSVITIIINLVFIYLVWFHIFRKGRSSKKRYTFLINRSISAVIAQILLYVVLIAWKAKSLHYSSATIFLLVGGLSILTHTGTYLAVTWMLYRAVTTPLWYKKNITMSLCLWIIGVIWLLSVGVSILFGLLGATLFYPNTAPIHCEFYHCQFPMAVTLVIIFLFSFFAVITFYLVMVLRIRMKNAGIGDQSRSKDGNERERLVTHDRNIRTMNRLSLNLVAFSISKLPLLIVAIVALANLHNLSVLGYGAKVPCKTFEHGRLFYEVECLASIAAILWLFGMSLDPVISIGTDPIFMEDLRKRYKQVCFFARRIRSCKSKPSLSREATLTTEEVNSSGEF
ncbi:G-PROTEIN-RECEP-F1-2 domain-containing protein [Aphelenchoides besseyi]|nr:G-PROTEIN-RECEP-F1-2 domain-containing protein [Aphelenchoides besseyi]